MYAKINAMSIRGIDGIPVSVEVDISTGLPEFSLVGDLAPEVREARERVKTALRNSGIDIPPKRITINLAPADIKKEGTAFDLAIALGILSAIEIISCEKLSSVVALGELNLDGKVCPVPGVLPMVIAAMEAGYKACMVPEANCREAAFVKGIDIIPIDSLLSAINMLKKDEGFLIYDTSKLQVPEEKYDVDFSEINGQKTMRRAAEVAAAGMHNLFLIGSPGSGKTMIARRLPTILPELTWKESIETTRIYSVCGLTSAATPIKRARPFRTPHHTISAASLIGGGKHPKPGEISLANRGVLFLDELPEFQKNALESLRQPLEDREVSVVRMNGSFTFPANFMLVGAANPCKCGYYPDRNKCRCSESDVKRYMQRISRPLLDRIDICTEAPPINYKDLGTNEKNESSEDIRKRVSAAWEVQRSRFKGKETLFNSQMKPADIKKYCALRKEDEKMMEEAFEKMNLSARGYHRVLKVARTIADLTCNENIERAHLLEALSYRSVNEKIWS